MTVSLSSSSRFFFKGLPIELDGFIGAELSASHRRQRRQQLRLAGIDPRCAAESRQPVLGPPQTKTKIGEELIRLHVAGRGGDQLFSSRQRCFGPAKLRFQTGHMFQIGRATAAIDNGQFAVQISGGLEIAGLLKMRAAAPSVGTWFGSRLIASWIAFVASAYSWMRFAIAGQEEPIAMRCLAAGRVLSQSRGQIDELVLQRERLDLLREDQLALFIRLSQVRGARARPARCRIARRASATPQPSSPA